MSIKLVLEDMRDLYETMPENAFKIERCFNSTATKDKKIGTIFKIIRSGDAISLELEMDAVEGMEGAFTELLDSMWE